MSRAIECVKTAVALGFVVIGLFLLTGLVGLAEEVSDGGVIEGTVREINSGNGVAGVKITIEQTHYTTTTDENGYYITTIPATTYDLTASWSGLNVTKNAINVTANQTTTVDFDVGMLLPGMGYVVGTVSDKNSDRPVEGAIVSISGEEATTDRNGRYELMVFNTPYYGNYRIEARAHDYEPGAVYDTGPVGCDEEVNIDIVLTPRAEEKKGIPGFNALSAIAGLVTIAYLVKRRS